MFEVTCNEENAKTIDVAGVVECISAIKINIFHCLLHKVSLNDTVRSQFLITSESARVKKMHEANIELMNESTIILSE